MTDNKVPTNVDGVFVRSHVIDENVANDTGSLISLAVEHQFFDGRPKLTPQEARDVAHALIVAAEVTDPPSRCTGRDSDHLADRVECGYCLTHDDEDDADDGTIDVCLVATIVRAAGYEAKIEQTGGNVHTLYAGAIFQNNRYPVCAGPCVVDEAQSPAGSGPAVIVGNVAEFMIGPDDDGESANEYVAIIDDDEASIAERIIEVCKRSRFRPVTSAGPGYSFATRVWDTMTRGYVKREDGRGVRWFDPRDEAVKACDEWNAPEPASTNR